MYVCIYTYICIMYVCIYTIFRRPFAGRRSSGSCLAKPRCIPWTGHIYLYLSISVSVCIYLYLYLSCHLSVYLSILLGLRVNPLVQDVRGDQAARAQRGFALFHEHNLSISIYICTCVCMYVYAYTCICIVYVCIYIISRRPFVGRRSSGWRPVKSRPVL